MIVRPRFIWGAGDRSVLPRLCEAVRTGQFAWIGGGRHLTPTCHVDNVCEGLLLAAERGRGGETSFVTDGPPVELRAFLTAMLATQGLRPPDRSVPLWLARSAAAVLETSSRLLGVPRHPSATRMSVALMGQEVTVRDEKARRELGYVGRVSREEGLASMGS